MELGKCFNTLNSLNMALKTLQSDSRFVYVARVLIANDVSYTGRKECLTEEDLFDLIREVAEDACEDKNFFINVLTKESNFEFNDGKWRMHWENKESSKHIGVNLKLCFIESHCE